MLTPFFPSVLSPEEIAAAAADSCSCTYCLEDFGPLETAAEVTSTIIAAATTIGAMGQPAVICFPGGVLEMDALESTAVGVHEGAAVLLTEDMGNITFRGNRTTLKPVSNKVEMFAIDGANNIRLEGFFFDNADNGRLSGETPVSPQVPGSGTAGQGNAANCAIRQYSGANLTVVDCEFREFFTSIHYWGIVTDIASVSGTVSVTRCKFDTCVMGLLSAQPEHVVFENNIGIDGTNGEVAIPRTPGHDLYQAFRPGGTDPYTVRCCNNTSMGRESSPWKVRRGLEQVITGNVSRSCQDGIESHNGRDTTISGNTLDVVRFDGFEAIELKQFGIQVTGHGGVVDGNTINFSGAQGYPLRVRPADVAEDDEGEPMDGETPVGWRITDNVIKDDLSVLLSTPPGTAHPFIYLLNADDCTVADNEVYILGNRTWNSPVVQVDNCRNIVIRNNARFADSVGTPAGSDRLAFIDLDCEDIRVTYRRTDLGVGAPPSGTDTVIDNGTRTIRERNDGIIRGLWTPVAAFATVGDSVITHTLQTGWYQQQGPYMTLGCVVAFDTNGYGGTVAGPLRIGGHGFVAADVGPAVTWRNAVGDHQNIVTTATDIGVQIVQGTNFTTLRGSIQSGVGADLGVGAFPASGSGYLVGFQVNLEIVET